MKPSERLRIIQEIATELQSRYTFAEIDQYLGAFGLAVPEIWDGPNSIRVYSTVLLGNVGDAILSEIAEDLELSIATTTLKLPQVWTADPDLRMFISHISKDKDKALRLRDCLKEHGVSGFVAHEDIKPTVQWQNEIERALGHMHCFLAMHTSGFSESNWTQQEIGFAVARRTKIISLKMGETPTGFIGKEQALPRRRRKAEEIAKEIEELLAEDPRTRQYLPTNNADDEIPF